MILYTLSRLEPADSFAVARIDTGSFSEKDIIAKTTFDERPSMANKQKRAFAQKVHDFIARENAAQYTDITGGLLQAVEFLNEKGTGRKTILIFSDLEQDLDKGYVRDIEVPFEGFDVVALNVVKLRQDNYDPRQIPGAARTVEGPGGERRRTLARGERPRSARQHVVRGGGSCPESLRRVLRTGSVFRWLAREGGGISFLAMLAVPVVALTSIVAFAYSGRSRDEPRRLRGSATARGRTASASRKTSTSRRAASR